MMSTDRPTCPLRARMLAALSWLGLFSLGAPPLGAQDSKAPPPIDADHIRAVLARLDAAFRRGDVAAYLAEFQPDHPGVQAMLGRNLERLLSLPHHERTSTLVGEPRVIGPRTVVRVQQQIHLAGRDAAPANRSTANGKDVAPANDKTGASGAVADYIEHVVLALTRDAAGKVVPTFCVEFPSASMPISDSFRCPACNYQIGGTPGWLCVPLRRDRAGALEAASFYLMGTDIACDVTVQIDDEAPTAMELVDHLGTALCELEPSAHPGTAQAWLPPAHRQDPPHGLSGARLEIDLPASAPDGDRALFHVLAFGGLQHLLLLRGGQRQLAEHTADVDRFLASYRLLEKDCDLALAASRPLAHHTGGHLDGARYDNSLHGVSMQGPEGWKAALRCGGTAFRVVWQSEAGARLWLTGLTVPLGMPAWCRITADRWLQQLCRQRGLEPPPPADPGTACGWVDDPGCTSSTRTVLCKPLATPGSAADPTTLPMRWIHLQVHPDLLLVADGYASTAADEALLRQAFESLHRK